MKKNGNKEEILVYGENAIVFLQNTVDGLSRKMVEPSSGLIDFSRLKKLKISVKTKFGQPYVKCKVKYKDNTDILQDLVEGAEPDMEKPDYSLLKKRMKSTFQSIGDRLTNGSFPSSLEMDLFCKNAGLMTTYAGYGDSMYPEFLQLVDAFQDAFHKDDIQKCQEKYAEIKAMKKACHHEKGEKD